MLLKVLISPHREYEKLAQNPPSLKHVLFGYAVWLGLIPPVCAYLGTTTFGWHFGIGEPLRISATFALFISVAYYAFLLGGFLFSVLLMRWIAPTYGATTNLGAHAAVLVTVGMPLMLGGIVHLYPQIGLNLMLLVPAMIWSAFLLYIGLPKVMGIDADRGMLMATSMLGVFFVAANALMILSMALWASGIGPDLGFNWRFSISG